MMRGKVEVLEIAMHDAATDVVGLQESRSRQAGIFHGLLYSQMLWRGRQQRQRRLPVVDHGIVELHDAYNGRHYLETGR